jgi:hypothetical protein
MQTLFQAARAHSRLHQAAAVVMTDIQAHIKQQDINSLLLYVQRHSQHIRSITVTGFMVSLFELPLCPQLRQLSFEGMDVQLCAGTEHQGVLAANTALQQLQLLSCGLLDYTASLAAALQQLPLLQQLVVIRCRSPTREHDLLNCWADPCWQFPGGALHGLQQLTSLELHGGWRDQSKVLQHLCHLTNLEELHLLEGEPPAVTVTAQMLSQLSGLTRLQLGGSARMEAAVLAGKSRLQHLDLKYADVWAQVADGDDALAAGSAALLSELQQLQQLTHLSLITSMNCSTQSRAVYSALLASSKLHTLQLLWCTLPADAWPHVFPAGKHFPNLLVLDVDANVRGAWGAEGIAATLPGMQRLVSCCPNLQQVSLPPTLHTPELLAPLCGLTGLHTLRVRLQDNKGFGVLRQMTGLKELMVTGDNRVTDAGLLQLTALQQLSHLKFSGRGSVKEFKNKVSLLTSCTCVCNSCEACCPMATAGRQCDTAPVCMCWCTVQVASRLMVDSQ